MGKNVIKKLLQTSQACSEETEVFFPFDYKIRFRVCEKILRCSKIFAKFRVILIFWCLGFQMKCLQNAQSPRMGCTQTRTVSRGLPKWSCRERQVKF